MNLEDLKTTNPRYRGKLIGEIARLVFKPKHDRDPKPRNDREDKGKRKSG